MGTFRLAARLSAVFTCFFLLGPNPATAENYLLSGGQRSRIHYGMAQTVTPRKSTRTVGLTYVVPQSFNSPTYRQQITNTDFHFTPEPSSRKERIDSRGNVIIEVKWDQPAGPITANLSMTAENSVSLKRLKTETPFPVADLPEDVRVYLAPTDQVPASNARIVSKARELTSPAKSQFDAVQRILTWVVDHMHYVLNPEQYGALYSFSTGRGNCQNYSHLAAALMRAVGIPARIVNGVTLKRPYDVKIGNNTLTMKMAQGRHSWIEVYFSDLGWIPVDPQVSELFVSNRFIRVEIGLDNEETRQDGLLRWTYVEGSRGKPDFREGISGRFDDDRVDILAQKAGYGPREMLLCPDVDSRFAKVAVPIPPPPPDRIPGERLDRFSFTEPFQFGNLDFPANVDFVTYQAEARTASDGAMELRKNFMVETAEYVTTKGQQYAQVFVLDRPLRLNRVGLALHRFNDDGQLWAEILSDRDGTPGEVVAVSDFLSLSQVPFSPGYNWVDFDFSRSPVLLSPGKYWIALGFTGTPIVNWFFTYGKPVGPQDGTRYRTLFDATWSRSLSFEFNYRVVGLAAR